MMDLVIFLPKYNMYRSCMTFSRDEGRGWAQKLSGWELKMNTFKLQGHTPMLKISVN
jgi:hypothetical protein